MNPDDTIHEKSLQCMKVGLRDEDIQNTQWIGSMSVGEKVRDHNMRTYIEVLSPWYIGESQTNNYTGMGIGD